MPLATALAFAWNLSTTLMTCVVLFKAATGYGVMVEAEYDGDPASLVHHYDPFA